MRVYVPDKREGVISEILKDLYMLKKAIDYSTGNTDSRSAMVDDVREKLRTLLEDTSQNK